MTAAANPAAPARMHTQFMNRNASRSRTLMDAAAVVPMASCHAPNVSRHIIAASW
jgi:hypothetical protein